MKFGDDEVVLSKAVARYYRAIFLPFETMLQKSKKPSVLSFAATPTFK